ncbi:NF-kappa-B inhibitor zeta isoform X2 [Pempheris klunzingeri]|uniref:NF-kappa-B inhibitor zeta isoform X2 n=1 Tax=Pempheris klunzingeri TaxID=3127111 RepID=UPI00397F0099
MLDPRGDEARGVQSLQTGRSQSEKGFLISDPRPPEYTQAVHKKNTVKELLLMKRQKWDSSRDNNDTAHPFKFAKMSASHASPCLLAPFVPVNSNTADLLPPAFPADRPMTTQHMQHPALRGQVAPTPGVKVTLFHWQIQQEVKRLGGVSPELLSAQDGDGDTFLHIAVAQGRRALAYVLAAKMARCGSLDIKEHNGQTALQIAAATNQHFIVHDLLAHGAQINTRDLWGRSPLQVCAEKGHYLSLQSIWRTATGQLIDIEMFNYDGLTALHVAVLSHNAVVKELRTLESPCSYVMMQLLQRRQSYVECIQTLLLMGASCETKDLKSGRTCLHVASEEANVELLKIFLDQPSSLSLVNAKTFSGNTALHVVSSLQNLQSQVEAVKLLMRKGADPSARNFENELPSQLVPERPASEMVWKILKGKCFHA